MLPTWKEKEWESEFENVLKYSWAWVNHRLVYTFRFAAEYASVFGQPLFIFVAIEHIIRMIIRKIISSDDGNRDILMGVQSS